MKTVVLFDNCQDGHHLTYLQLFTKLLLEMGHTVLTFCPQSEQLRQWTEKNVPNHIHRLSTIEVAVPSVPKLPIFGNLPRTATVLAEWRYAASVIRQAANLEKTHIDLVFFAWLDSYLSPYLSPTVVDKIFPYKWSGLYFNPPHLIYGDKVLPVIRKKLSTYALLRSDRCQGAALLHELEAKQLQKQLSKPVEIFPDLTDEALPETDYELAEQVRSKARGRLVIGLLGGLTQRKGLMTLIETAQKTAHEEWLFVFAGRLYEQELSAQQLTQIQSFVQSKPDNCLLHLERIPKESQFNAIVETCDVLFAAYENFPYSSNLITKAAVFEKPIIVSEGYCMAQRVETFRMGLSIPENDVDSCVNAIKKLELDLHRQSGPTPDFDGYRQVHSVHKLRCAFSAIIEPKPSLSYV